MTCNHSNLLRNVHFSWLGVVVAPLLVPAIFAGLTVWSNPGGSRILGFLLMTALGSIVAYPATLFLLLPCLLALSRMMTLKWYWVWLTGLMLGLFLFLPISWIEYRSSGPDSGPPVG